MRTTHPIYGLMAEFDNPSDLVAAARRTYEEGYRRINGYSPFPIEELSEAIGFHHTRLPLIVLIGGIIGGLGGYLMQYYVATTYYPLNVGGRPFHSWPSFVPITFETTVLCDARAQQSAAAVSSGLQRAALRARHARPLLSGH